MKASTQRKLLMTALLEYGTWTFPKTQKAMAVIDVDNQRYGISFQDVCSQAYDVLRDDAVHKAKFEALVQGLHKLGLERAYEIIMNEDIKKALR